MLRCFFIAVVVLSLSACNPASEPFKADRNIPYGPHARHTFDFYEPPYDTGNSLRPAIIVIHGGAWHSGDKEWGENIAEEFCPRGYVVFSINYRLSGDDPWPAQIEDCQRAYAYIREQSWAHVDTERMSALGVSAGAHLAAMLHLRGDDRIPYAISVSGPYDFVNDRSLDEPLNILLGVPAGTVAPIESLVDVSPVTFVHPQANMLLIHATGDPVVPYSQATGLHEALLLQNADVTLLTDHGDGHGRVWRGEVNAIATWLASRQGPPRDPGSLAGIEDDTRKFPKKLGKLFK